MCQESAKPLSQEKVPEVSELKDPNIICSQRNADSGSVPSAELRLLNRQTAQKEMTSLQANDYMNFMGDGGLSPSHSVEMKTK